MKVLLIGPLPDPITGVSLANKIVVNYLPEYTNIQIFRLILLILIIMY
jgi:hypothetical protein